MVLPFAKQKRKPVYDSSCDLCLSISAFMFVCVCVFAFSSVQFPLPTFARFFFCTQNLRCLSVQKAHYGTQVYTLRVISSIMNGLKPSVRIHERSTGSISVDVGLSFFLITATQFCLQLYYVIIVCATIGALGTLTSFLMCCGTYTFLLSSS